MKPAKAKAKASAKLKSILVNPYIRKCPSLEAHELTELKNLIRTATIKDGVKPHLAASANHICLGLESSLRAINNSNCSCVLISLSIKPRHIVSLIARSVEYRSKTVPIYVQPELENFTEAIFGIRALALVLPADIKHLGGDLEHWVKSRNRIAETIQPSSSGIKRIKKTNKKKSTKKNISTTCNDMEISTPTIVEEPKKKSWSDDYISFTNDNDNVQMNKLKLSDDKEHLMSALNEMINIKKNEVNKNIEVAKEELIKTADIAIAKPSKESTDSDDEENFLKDDVYKSLIVHKVRPNPDKIKKKRRKNKNKNKNKA